MTQEQAQQTINYSNDQMEKKFYSEKHSSIFWHNFTEDARHRIRLNRLLITVMIKWKKSFTAKNTLAYFGTASVKIKLFPTQKKAQFTIGYRNDQMGKKFYGEKHSSLLLHSFSEDTRHRNRLERLLAAAMITWEKFSWCKTLQPILAQLQ